MNPLVILKGGQILFCNNVAFLYFCPLYEVQNKLGCAGYIGQSGLRHSLRFTAFVYDIAAIVWDKYYSQQMV
jgi:hypothetical protein